MTSYTQGSVSALMLNNNIIRAYSSKEFYEFASGLTGMFSVPGFAKEFLAWAQDKSEKVVIDKAKVCHTLWLNKCSLETMLSTLNGSQLQLALSDLPSEETIDYLLYQSKNIQTWIKKFYKASSRKDEVTKALISVSKFTPTRYGWEVTVGDVSNVFSKLVDDDTLDVVLSNKKAYFTFKKWLISQYPQYKEYIHYILSYGDMGKKGKSLALEMCRKGNLRLSEEFDTPKLVPAAKGFILVHGAGPLVKEISQNLGVSTKEATDLIKDGKETLKKIIYSKEYCNTYPFRCLSWKILRWWTNKEGSVEWDKDRVTYGPAGEQVHWTWRSRLDEIVPDYIQSDKDSPAKVMDRVFHAEEERLRKAKENIEDLKKEEPFEVCPLSAILPSDEFKQVLTPYELKCTGDKFQNCVFTYKSAVRDKKCYIFQSDDLCIEICPPQTKKDWRSDSFSGQWRIQQCYGYRNSTPKRDSLLRLQKWFNDAVVAFYK